MITAESIIQQLALEPLRGEGGYYRETYRSPLILAENALPPAYGAARQVSTAIYYLLTPDTFSALHLLPGDEVYHFYTGDPVEMLQLHPDGSGEIIQLGSDLTAGLRPQIVVQGGHWQGSRLTPGGRFALMGCTMAPGFEFADYTGGDRAELLREYPQFSEAINALTVP